MGMQSTATRKATTQILTTENFIAYLPLSTSLCGASLAKYSRKPTNHFSSAKKPTVRRRGLFAEERMLSVSMTNLAFQGPPGAGREGWASRDAQTPTRALFGDFQKTRHGEDRSA